VRKYTFVIFQLPFGSRDMKICPRCHSWFVNS